MRDQAGTAAGWCSRGASLPAEHSWLCPGVQQEIQVSMVPIWFIHLQPRHSLGIPSNIPWLSWELREGEHRKDWGGLTPSPGPSSVPRSSSVKKFKNQQLLAAGGWQLLGQDWLCQREWQQEALGSRSWRG